MLLGLGDLLHKGVLYSKLGLGIRRVLQLKRERMGYIPATFRSLLNFVSWNCDEPVTKVGTNMKSIASLSTVGIKRAAICPPIPVVCAVA